MSGEARGAVPPRDAIVVGAGIVGMSCALFLQKDGHRVTVLDRGEPGAGASFGNAGILAYSAVAPIAMPGIVRRVPRMLVDPYGPLVVRWRYLPRIARWLVELAKASRPDRVEAIAAALAALLSRADRGYERLVREAGAEDVVRRPGWLKVYAGEAGFAATAQERALMERHGVRADIVGADEIRQMEPGLAPIFGAGLFMPDCGFVVNPKRLVETIAATFVARGGHIAREVVSAIRPGADRHEVAGDGATRQADIVVLAAGAWSRRLAGQLGAAVPLDTERGYHLMFETPDPGLRRPTLWGDRFFGLLPMEHGMRMTSGIEFAGLDAPADWRRIDRLATLARRMLPSLPAEPSSRWLGFRPSLPDSLPVLGTSSRHRGVYFAFGHQHLGLTLGPVSGRIVADLAAGRDPGLDLAPYRAERWSRA